MLLRRKLSSVMYVLLVIGGLFVCLFVIKKMKYLYDRNQKYSRLESYKQYMEEISDYMHSVEISANKSAASLHRLNSALHRQQQQQQQLTIGMGDGGAFRPEGHTSTTIESGNAEVSLAVAMLESLVSKLSGPYST